MIKKTGQPLFKKKMTLLLDAYYKSGTAHSSWPATGVRAVPIVIMAC